MPFKKNKTNSGTTKNEGVVKSIFIAYSILLSHLILIAVLGLLVLFFRGVVNYLTWIFLAGFMILIGSGFYFIRKLKKEQKSIREILLLPEFAGKDIEIKLLGGAASFKVGNSPSNNNQAQAKSENQYIQLENPVKSRIENLGEISRLYENQMISKEEYEDLKKELFGNKLLDNEDDDIFDIEPSNETIETEIEIKNKNGKKNDQN
ncbi:MAG: hypothetical protein RBR53_05280 [Desulforegulaceae bacterium]|nr:hypothetical protein [Desulforegulaceae bacterium]